MLAQIAAVGAPSSIGIRPDDQTGEPDGSTLRTLNDGLAEILSGAIRGRG
jgi:hypothetical protein